eukprot:CAMPEP_0116541510 /NCGR_PEP_ID=MMETSP0397-20121206/521_1 /TAXON_ID=216820 /ORGANISM="Cyclophora tenuis, Strain ECT3854" /LENGTH=210 /DNA_ID=CAMNT_0004065457 /DNA_START=3 /DNA_END=635 /DNA_ORIENTATION=-
MDQIFERVHENFLQLRPMDQSGTTATFIYVTDEIIVVASLGDSRAIVSSYATEGGSSRLTAIQLTTDHVASNPDEQAMVEERGGYVQKEGGIFRVAGKLAITRSLGDSHLAPYLSREPHVVVMTKDELLDDAVCASSASSPLPCFVVLASDGLWDVMTNQEVVDMVAEEIEMTEGWEEQGAFQKAAERLTQEAYIRGSTDNIGVCVVAIT